jgi:hypothetical protein
MLAIKVIVPIASDFKLYEILTKIYSAYKIAKGSDSLLTETVRQMKQVLQQLVLTL